MDPEAAAIPLAAMTSAVGLYTSSKLGLPQPWTPAKEPLPLIIYGASSAVGAYAVQLALRSNIHPLICVAGKSTQYVESLGIDTSRGDVVIDYQQGEEGTVAAIRKAAGGAKLLHAYDAISEKGSYRLLGKVLDAGAKITTVLPALEKDAIPAHVEHSLTLVGSVHSGESSYGHKMDDNQVFAYVYFRYFAKGLQDGWFKPLPQVVVPGGIHGIQEGLNNLKEGKAHGNKFVFRIAEEIGSEGSKI